MFDYVAVILASLFSIVCALGIQQLWTSFRTRNRKLNMRNAIVFIMTFSAILRSFYFTKVSIPTTWDDGFMMSLFIIPLWMQGLAISLLVTFYASIVYYNSGHTEVPLIICMIFNLGVLIEDVSISTSFAGADSAAQVGRLMLTYCCTSVIEDLLLAVLLVYFGSGFKKIAVDGHGYGNVLATWSERSVTVFDAMNWLLTFSMIFRAALTLVFYLTPSLHGTTSITYNGSHGVTSPLVCVFFFFAELVPSLCVLIMLFRVDATSEKEGGHGGYTHYRVVSTGGGTGVADDSNLDTRLLSKEDSKVRVILNGMEDGEEGALDSPPRGTRGGGGYSNSSSSGGGGATHTRAGSYKSPMSNHHPSDMLAAASPAQPMRSPLFSATNINNHRRSLDPSKGDVATASTDLEAGGAVTAVADSGSNIDSKGVFRSAFSPDEGSLVDDLMAQARETSAPLRESDSSNSGGGGSGSGVLSGFGSSFPGSGSGSGSGNGSRRTSVPSFLRRTPSPGALHPPKQQHLQQQQQGIKIRRETSPGIYSYTESPAMTEGFSMTTDAMVGDAAATPVSVEKGAGVGDMVGKDGEKYSEYVSPRDILMRSKGKR